MKPSGIQRRAPLTPLPTKGSSTTTSSSSAATKIQGESFSQTETGICTTTSAAITAIAMDSRCRLRK